MAPGSSQEGTAPGWSLALLGGLGEARGATKESGSFDCVATAKAARDINPWRKVIPRRATNVSNGQSPTAPKDLLLRELSATGGESSPAAKQILRPVSLRSARLRMTTGGWILGRHRCARRGSG